MARATKSAVASPFDALINARKKTAEQSAVQTANQVDGQPVISSQQTGKLAKSVDGNYLKFTTYIRKGTHRAVKLTLMAQDRELSDLVEELLSEWLQKQSGTNF